MRIQRLAMTVAGAAVVALALTACNNDDTDAGGSTSSAPSASASASGSGGGSDGGGSSSNAGGTSGGTASGSSGSSNGGGTTAAGASNRCHTGDLSLQAIIGPQEDPATNGGKGNFYIQLTNKSSRTCTLYGYAGVELYDANSGQALNMKDVRSSKLNMDGDKVTKQTLAPNQSSAANIVFDTRTPGGTAGEPRVSKVQVFPPDETKPLTANIYSTTDTGDGATLIMVTSKTLTLGPMSIDGVPHK